MPKKHVDFEVPAFAELNQPVMTRPSYAQRMLAIEPTGYWRHITVANVVPDASGHGHHGEARSATGLSPGAVHRDADEAMRCDGQGRGIEISASPELSGFANFTLLFWLHLPGPPEPFAWIAGVYASNDRSWLVRFDSLGQLSMLLSNNGQTHENLIFHEAALNAQTWHHVALRRTGIDVTCLIDGQWVQTRTHAGVLHTAAEMLYLGRAVAIDLDEVVLVRSSISDAAITDAYHAARAFHLPS